MAKASRPGNQGAAGIRAATEEEAEGKITGSSKNSKKTDYPAPETDAAKAAYLATLYRTKDYDAANDAAWTAAGNTGSRYDIPTNPLIEEGLASGTMFQNNRRTYYTPEAAENLRKEDDIIYQAATEMVMKGKKQERPSETGATGNHITPETAIKSKNNARKTIAERLMDLEKKFEAFGQKPIHEADGTTAVFPTATPDEQAEILAAAQPTPTPTKGVKIGGQQETGGVQQYLYPEDRNAGIQMQNTEPFADWQKGLIDEINTAQDERDFDTVSKLLKIYRADDAENQYKQHQYEGSLPQGKNAYSEVKTALQNGDNAGWQKAKQTLLQNGYSEQQINNEAAEVIHHSNKSAREKEADLQKYLDLDPSDAQATSIMWWWNDSNQSEDADTNGNGKVTQNELGTYLRNLEQSGTLNNEQATVIWQGSFPKAKTTYEVWTKKNKK